MLIKRGDIFYADLNPVVGSEQGGVRPVLVVQNNVGNKHSPTVVVVPISSVRKKDLPVHIQIRCSGLKIQLFLLNRSALLTAAGYKNMQDL